MRTISSAIAAHLTQEVTTLSTCLKIERRDGVSLGFTDHDQDLLLEGFLYAASDGFNPTSVNSSNALNIDRLDIETAISDTRLRAADIAAGLYDGAWVTLLLVNHQAPEDGALILKHGTMGEITLSGGQFKAELRGLTQALQRTAVERFSPTCRAEFGDAKCGVNLAAHRVSGTVDGATGDFTVLDAVRTEAAGFYDEGTMRFDSGVLAGQLFRVSGFAPGVIRLALPFAQPPGVGDVYTLTQGCDKRFGTCTERYNNALNFRGEPHLPGLDRILQTPSTSNDLVR